MSVIVFDLGTMPVISDCANVGLLYSTVYTCTSWWMTQATRFSIHMPFIITMNWPMMFMRSVFILAIVIRYLIGNFSYIHIIVCFFKSGIDPGSLGIFCKRTTDHFNTIFYIRIQNNDRGSLPLGILVIEINNHFCGFEGKRTASWK